MKNKHLLFKSPILQHSVLAVRVKCGVLREQGRSAHPTSVSGTELVLSLI